MTQPYHAVVIIGAGIVGACIALSLSRRGIDTLLVDRQEPGSGCSFGNSGAISPSSVAPLAMPGILASLPGMLSDPLGPLHLPPAYLPRALPWLVRFLASARPVHVERSVARLAHLHRGALELHRALTHEVGVPELLLERAHLHLYPDDAAFAKDAAGWRLRAEHGFSYDRLDSAGIHDLEPGINARYRLGVLLKDHGTLLNPHRYVRAIVEAACTRGARLLRADVRDMRFVEGAWHLDMDAPPVRARHVVVAAGAWSNALLARRGVRLRLESQRGYHVQFAGEAPVSRTVVLADRKVFLTPMEAGLRAGGTVEIAGLNAPPTRARSEALAGIAREALAGIDLGPCVHWMGHRPCMPDSAPVIGPAQGHPGLWVATGHGHLGLTDAPATGLLIAEAIAVALSEPAQASASGAAGSLAQGLSEVTHQR